MIMKIMIITTFMMIMTIEIKVFFPPPTDGLSCKNCPSCHCLPLPGRHCQDQDQEHDDHQHADREHDDRHHHNDQDHQDHDDCDNDNHDCDDHEVFPTVMN